MKVLLKDGAEVAGPTTILIAPERLRESVLGTLAGEGWSRSSYVAEVEQPTVTAAVSAAIRKRDLGADARRRMLKDVASMAQVLASYEVRSRILLHITPTGADLDPSQVILVDGGQGERDRRARSQRLRQLLHRNRQRLFREESGFDFRPGSRCISARRSPMQP